jgi:predicted O-methyltransferase YrrM
VNSFLVPQSAGLASSIALEAVLRESAHYRLPADHPRNEWALAEDACRFLAALVRRVRPRRVLEFGSGISTAVIAAELERGGDGLLFTIDHSETFQAKARQTVREIGCERWVRFYRCPIRPAWYFGKVLFFYRLPASLWSEAGEIDLVLVDGPPGNWGREAAMYSVFGQLKIGGWLLLDDATRPAETKHVREWVRYFGKALEYDSLPRVGRGLSLLQKSAATPQGEAFDLKACVGAGLETLKTLRMNRQRLWEWW